MAFLKPLIPKSIPKTKKAPISEGVVTDLAGFLL